MTQALLGAAAGQAFFSQQLGRRAALYGAAAGLLPDLDIIVTELMGTVATWQHHRGVTHALWFPLVAAPLMAWAARAFEGRKAKRSSLADVSPPAAPPPFAALAGVFCVALLSHPLLDWFTSYGTQLLAPFSSHRFALDAIAIIDPLYTVPLAAAVIIGAKAPWRRTRWVASLALVGTTGYLFYTWHLNVRAEHFAVEQLEMSGLSSSSQRVEAYPTLLQPHLRRVVVQDHNQYLVGYLSLWTEGPIVWQSHRRLQGDRLDRVAATHPGRVLAWMAQGMALGREVPLAEGSMVELIDLRYGMPGTDGPGFWGVRARFDGTGRMVTEVRPFQRRPSSLREGLAVIFQRAYRSAPAPHQAALTRSSRQSGGPAKVDKPRAGNSLPSPGLARATRIM